MYKNFHISIKSILSKSIFKVTSTIKEMCNQFYRFLFLKVQINFDLSLSNIPSKGRNPCSIASIIEQKKQRCERLEKLKKTPCSRIRYTRCITIIERANGKKEEISTRFHFLHGSLCARRIPIHATHRGAGTKG